ncbi:MAG: aspartate kinase [Candidatus Syntrophosphaera sp.]|nr:aspartate kinase [Candidatus Syntrophosphaera sp.]
MAIIVKKFGGTSVGSIELIRNIAKKIASEHRDGDSLVLVISAMAKTTDELMKMAYGITGHPSRRELDMLLTAGERISMSLLSLALQEEGFDSISFTGSQSGIITDAKHGNARILNVNAFRINQELDKGKIVIVAGFQGVSQSKEITTLGRGGSDTSAVALACYLQAANCDIYTDVDGVFTADPKLVPNAKLIPRIDYERMLALSYNGSRVMHPRSIEFASKYGIPVEVKSSLTFAPGTLICGDTQIEGKNMEERNITAIAHKENLLRHVVANDRKLRELLKNWNNEIYRYFVENGQVELMIEEKYDSEVKYILDQHQVPVLRSDAGLGCVTLVGLGINLDPGFLAETLDVCQPFAIQRVQHSEKTIELTLPSAEVRNCVRALHEAFIGGDK